MDYSAFESKVQKIFNKQVIRYTSNVMTSNPFKISFVIFNDNDTIPSKARLHFYLELLNGEWYINVYFRPLHNEYKRKFMFEKIHRMRLDEFSFSLIANYISAIKREAK